MKPITLKEALLIYVNAVLENNDAPNLYLKDGDHHYHRVDEIDLNRYEMCCDDGYDDYYKYILKTEGSENHKLFVEEENDNEHIN